MSIYKELLSLEDPDPLYHIYAAACRCGSYVWETVDEGHGTLD